MRFEVIDLTTPCSGNRVIAWWAMKPRVWRAALFYASFTTLVGAWDFALRIRNVIHMPTALRWINRRANHMARIVLAITRLYMDHRVEFSSSVRLESIPDRFLLLANHQSIVDVPVLMSVFRNHSLRFTAKRSLFRRIPLISLVLRLQRHAAVNRGANTHETIAELKRLAKMEGDLLCPVIFPEGTRSRTGELAPFQAGAVSLVARSSGLPILCVSMDGGYRVSDAASLGMNLQACLYRIHVERIYFPPINRRKAHAIAEESETLIRRRLKIWRKEKGVSYNRKHPS